MRDVCMRAPLMIMPMSYSGVHSTDFDTSATWSGSPMTFPCHRRGGLPLSDATKCRYESGESCPASWAQCSPQTASVCGHHLSGCRPRKGKSSSIQVWVFDFDSRRVGWNHKVISSRRCDQSRCVAAVSIECHGDLCVYLQLCRLDWAQ